ncbi:hypothetical protein ATG_18580 [Desulfurococcaceae archaeon AG1]|jgi:hypothetical protein|nr:MAG: hypothetical protein DJ555_04900 [Desulfurococcaceae archaeon]GAY26654.1 hypothetical protein ATG_18580 [Desulfurococcaceae archaeon AG1]
MSIDVDSSTHILDRTLPSFETDEWEPPQPVVYALRIIDLINGKKDPKHSSHVDRELRLYASMWISSLKLFRYDHDLARYIVTNSLPENILRGIAANLEDLAISTSIILSEDRVPLSDAITYMELLDRSIGVKSSNNYISMLILRGGRLSDIASRVALLILYIISFYIAAQENEDA